MKKSFLFFTLIALTLISAAQSPEVARLKDILKSHTAQDTFRVNRLNEIASISILASEEREKYATEALNMSNKINYVSGRGNALALLGTFKFRDGKPVEAKTLFMQADAIAKKTADPELQANVLWRSSILLQDKKEYIQQVHQADSLASTTDNYELRVGIVTEIINSISDKKRQMELALKADSLAMKIDKYDLRLLTLGNIAALTSDIEEKVQRYLRVDSFAKKAGDLEARLNIFKSLGFYLLSKGNKKGLEYFFQGEQIAKQSGSKIQLGNAQLNIGDGYTIYLSDYVKGMEYYLKGLHSAEESNDPGTLIYSWNGLGSLYAAMGDQKTALTYLLKAENASKKLGDKELEANLQNSIGERYRLSNQYPEAIAAYNKSIKLITSSRNISVAQSNLADVYTRMGNLPLAFHYAFTSLKTIKELNDIVLIAWIDGILSRAYLKKDMADSAIYYASLGLDRAKQTGNI